MRGWIGVSFAIFIILGLLYVLNNSNRTVSFIPTSDNAPVILFIVAFACFAIWIAMGNKGE